MMRLLFLRWFSRRLQQFPKVVFIFLLLPAAARAPNPSYDFSGVAALCTPSFVGERVLHLHSHQEYDDNYQSI